MDTRAEDRRFGPLSALRAHTKAPYKMDFHRKTLRALNRPEAARTVTQMLSMEPSSQSARSARAENSRKGLLSALRAHAKSPYKMDFHRKLLRALNRPKAARTVQVK